MKNSIEAVTENKSLKYSPMDCFEDCFNLGRTIAEEINKRNQQQQVQQHQGRLCRHCQRIETGYE